VYREDNVKKKWDSFYTNFNYYFNIVCPKARRNSESASKAPWINKVLIARTKLKKLYDHYMQSKIQVDKDIYKKEYNVIIKTAKAKYVQNSITNSNF
jgi:hypothetical protein